MLKVLLSVLKVYAREGADKDSRSLKLKKRNSKASKR